jgi:hypothetical protein
MKCAVPRVEDVIFRRFSTGNGTHKTVADEQLIVSFDASVLGIGRAVVLPSFLAMARRFLEPPAASHAHVRNAERFAEHTLKHSQSGNVFCLAQL